MNQSLIEDVPNDDLDLKRSFAEALLKKPEDPYGAAMSVTDNCSQAIIMANDWVNDPDVKKFKEDHINEQGASHFLTNRDEYAREVMDKARKIKDPGEAHKYYKLYGDIRGFIEKPQNNTNVNVQNISNRVMVVPTRSTTEDWEKGLLEQQRKLSDDS